MSYITFDKNQLINLEYSLSKELICTNKTGAYSSSTIIGCNTRKYHGLLVSPVAAFQNVNYVLLSSVDEAIIVDDSTFNLGIHKYPGDNYHPKGHKYVREFYVDNCRAIIYRIGNIVLEKEMLLCEKSNQLLIKYTLLESSEEVTIQFKPFPAYRDIHSLSKSNLDINTKTKKIPNGVSLCLYNDMPTLHLQFSKAVGFVPSPDWYYNIEYYEDLKNGYDYQEDLFTPGFFETSMKEGETLILSASTREVKPTGLKRFFTTEYKKKTPRDTFKLALENAAEQFILKGKDSTEIYAGYHWLEKWGRETFISLPGLTLATGRTEICGEVLDSMVALQKGGLFPKAIRPDNVIYNGADTSLWFIWAVQQYSQVLQNDKDVWMKYSEPIKNVLEAFKNGTENQIQLHDNGLIYCGESEWPLTWMNAFVQHVPVTPRVGYPVEVNALWYNAVCYTLALAEAAGDKEFVASWRSLPEKISTSFNHSFWNETTEELADLVNNDQGDFSVRCNVIIACSLPYSPLTIDQQKLVVDTVKNELLTPRGLRTLSPKNPAYKGIYLGNQDERNAAYHQGTVWPWLLEHYVAAYLSIHKKSGLSHIEKIISSMESTILEHGIGTISEIFDGNPPHKPRGAISYGPSVAALLRIINQFELFNTKP